MTRSALLGVTAAGALALAGCYTVLQAPRRLVDGPSADAEARAEQAARAPSSDEAQWADLYAYPGLPGRYSGGYGGGYGYGGYRLGSDYYYYGAPAVYPYYSFYGYGPYSYGYDPYYRDSYGYYVPPGYKLVTQAELDALEASLEALRRAQPAPDPEAEQARKLEEQRQAQETWERRTQPTVRRSPTPTPKSPDTAAPAATSSPAITSGSASSATPAPATTVRSADSSSKAAEADEPPAEPKPSGTPTKRRR